MLAFGMSALMYLFGEYPYFSSDPFNADEKRIRFA
jgi:hypothetical protein